MDPIPKPLLLKMKLMILAWLHLRSQIGSPSLLKRFSYKDIKRATDGFTRFVNNSYGGTAYKAKFHDGHVATVKEATSFDEDDGAFFREVELLGRLHHRHIVELSGFSTGSKRFLVYEYMERGSLKDYLSDPLKTPLNWKTRLQIIVGIAAALEYLHFFCDPPVYHVSLSSSTILLDEKFIAKISCVSLHIAAENQGQLPTSSSCSKECTGQECKNTIFQLGLLILELITGQSSEKGGFDLVQWVQELRPPRPIHKMIDPDLGSNYDTRELDGLLNVARLCLRCVDKPRIYTSQILWYLQKKMGIARR